jgi:hypothetical protein
MVTLAQFRLAVPDENIPMNPPPKPPSVVRDLKSFSRMLDGIVRSVEQVMDRPEEKPAQSASAEVSEPNSKTA